MLKRHEVEILWKAGHSKTEVARLTGVSLCSVKRMAQESPVVHVDDAAERSKPQIREILRRVREETRCLPPVTTTPTTGIFKRNCTHRSVMKLLARILDKTVGSPLTSRTVFWSGSTFPQGRPCSMLLVEQEARRSGSPLPPAVLSCFS